MPNDASIRIRPARADDLPGVRNLLRAADLPLDGLDDQFGDNYAVAEAAGSIVGAEGIEIYGQHGLLRSAVVSAAWRGRGVGEALTTERLAWARERGLQAVYLLTTTAAGYFPRFGFVSEWREQAPEAIRRSREFADACPETAAFMRLTLAPKPSPQ